MLRWNVLILVDRHLGWLGIVSMPILVVAMVLAWMAAEAEMDSALLSTKLVSQQPIVPAGTEDTWRSQLKSELPQLENSASTQSELIRIAGEYEIEIEHAEYRSSAIKGLGIYKFQASLSLRGDYPSIRACLREWLALPGIVMDRLQVEKGESGLETKIELGQFYQAKGSR